MNLKGKTAFVADVSGAFGPSIVGALQRSGASVAAGVSPAKSASGGDISGAMLLRHDPSEPASWDTALSQAEDALGQVDFVINNPDLLLPGSIADCSTEDWARVSKAMILAVMLGMRHTIPRLRRANAGAIVNIASIGSDLGLGNYVSYAASAYAIRAMTRSAAMDCQMKKYPVRVCCLLTGFPDAEPFDGIAPDASVSADDVANGAVFLCSEFAAGITGTEIFIDNGLSVRPV